MRGPIVVIMRERRGQFYINLFCINLFPIAFIFSTFFCSASSSSNATTHRYSEHARYKRQFDTSSASQIDLNITVPYIFSARLYPYGPVHGDRIAQLDPQPFYLQAPLFFLDRSYDVIYVHHDGLITMMPEFNESPSKLPLSSPLMAVYWMRTRGGRVYYRESTEQNILTLAQSEVNIQYRYGNDFQAKSVAVITWEELVNEKEREEKSKNNNVFQIALIIGDNACFAHIVYSRLATNSVAVVNVYTLFAGFNGIAPPPSTGLVEHFSLPGSGTPQSVHLLEKSNIGIPGEWLFRIDEERVYLCGAGFQGLECVDSCSPSQWYLDCSRQCHCADGNACNAETGECPDGRCNPGWEGTPICDQDIDECTLPDTNCPTEQPDCVNTPGAYLCLCFEYDNITNSCKGSQSVRADEEKIPVPVMPLVPLLVPSASRVAPNFPTLNSRGGALFGQPSETIRSHNHPSIILAPPRGAVDGSSPVWTPPATISPIFDNGDNLAQAGNTVFEIVPNAQFATPPVTTLTEAKPAFGGEATFFQQQQQPIGATFAPMTIRPFLGTRPPPPPAPIHQLPHRQRQQFQHQRSQTLVWPSSLHDSQNVTTFSPSISVTSTVAIPSPAFRSDDACSSGCHSMAQCTQGRCVCISGWIGDGQNCEDVNECLNPNACGQHAECRNSAGSYQCVCDVGFTATGAGCVDVDECLDGSVQCRGGDTSVCVNMIGGYECQCRAGYTGHPDSAMGCVDIDECELSAFYCGVNATCVNLSGSFRCDCFNGYAPSAPGTTQCVDIDECAASRSPCDLNAKCTNLDGSFRCECNDGFSGSGVECHATILYSVAKNALVVTQSDVPIFFDSPIVVFGREYLSVYISPFGLLSFDQPLPGMIRSAASELRSTAFLPYHLAFNTATSGLVTFQRISGTMNSNEQLMSASLMVQSKFSVQDFRAVALYIITYDRMREVNLEKVNTFQVLIVKGMDNTTFLAYLYEAVESAPRGVVGVASPLAFTYLPADRLTAQSNVGQDGRWMFKVDQPVIVECPAGRRDAPLCQQDCAPGTWSFNCSLQCRCANNVPCDPRNGFCANGRCADGWSGFSCSNDVDECADGRHRCHANATCQNVYGTYDCRCNSDFYGDGFHCEAIDRCLSRFGVQCAPNAHCDMTAVELPECVCNDGFHGDGRRDCRPDSEIETTEPQRTITTVTMTTTTTTTSATTVVTLPSSTTAYPTITETTQQYYRPDFQDQDNQINTINGLDGRESTDAAVEAHHRLSVQNWETDRTSGSSPPPTQPSFIDFSASPKENSLLEQNVSSKAAAEDSSGLLLILGPIVFCAIWLILVATFLTICLCRRRRARADRYTPQMMGWSPRDCPPTTNRNSYFSQFTYT